MNRLSLLRALLAALAATVFTACGSQLTSSGSAAGGITAATADIVVSADGGSIQAAVDAADAGDTIFVEPGIYREQVIINKDLTLAAPADGPDRAVVVAPDAPAQFRFPESGAVWEPVLFAAGGTIGAGGLVSGSAVIDVGIGGFVIDGNDRSPSGRAAGILFRNADSSRGIRENDVRNMHIGSKETFGIIAYGNSELTITGNSVRGWARGGIGANGDGGAHPAPVAHIRDNEVIGPGRDEDVIWAPNGIQLGYGAGGSIMRNYVAECGWPGEEWSGSGIIVFETDGITIQGNRIENTERAISVGSWGWFLKSADNNRVVRNRIDGADYGIVVAATVLGSYTNMDPEAVNNKVIKNDLAAEQGITGISLYAFGGEGSGFKPVARNNKAIANSISGFDTAVDDSATDSKVHANSTAAP